MLTGDNRRAAARRGRRRRSRHLRQYTQVHPLRISRQCRRDFRDAVRAFAGDAAAATASSDPTICTYLTRVPPAPWKGAGATYPGEIKSRAYRSNDTMTHDPHNFIACHEQTSVFILTVEESEAQRNSAYHLLT